MTYIDGFVLPVPVANLAAYRKVAKLAGKVWRDHGALAYVEAIGDDTPEGKTTSFPKAVKLKAGEVVVFSWIIYESKAARNRINKLVKADPRMQMDWKSMPFDGKRMVMGGFKPLVQL